MFFIVFLIHSVRENGVYFLFMINRVKSPYAVRPYCSRSLYGERNDAATTCLMTAETFKTFKGYNYTKDKIKTNVGHLWALLPTNDEVLRDTHNCRYNARLRFFNGNVNKTDAFLTEKSCICQYNAVPLHRQIKTNGKWKEVTLTTRELIIL